MNFKAFIAIFFSVIFFGKFLVMDSKILVSVFDTEKIAFVNPFCEKQKAKIYNENSQETLAEDKITFSFTIDTICNAPFQFKVFSWESRVIPEESRTYAHHTPSLPESNKDRFYPPPQA